MSVLPLGRRIAEVGRSRRWLREIEEIARKEQDGGRPLIEDPVFRDRLVQVEVELLALESMVLRALSSQAEGRPPATEASILKIRGTEIQQSLTQLMVEAVGPYAVPFLPEDMAEGWNESPVGPDYAATAAPRSLCAPLPLGLMTSPANRPPPPAPTPIPSDGPIGTWKPRTADRVASLWAAIGYGLLLLLAAVAVAASIPTLRDALDLSRLFR